MVAWANGKAVVVLGAGATRGAEFVDSPDGQACVPPLNADFFTQLQRVQADNLQPDVDAVMRDVIESFGANFNLTLEEYFTHIEALLKGGSAADVEQQEVLPGPVETEATTSTRRAVRRT